MPELYQDVRYGLRMLAKNPGFTAIAILTLALGIGANTAIFSLLNQILLRRLPVENPQELVVLTSPGPKHGHVWSDGDDSEIFSYPLYKGLAKNTTVFDGVLARYEFSASIASQGQTDRGSGELVTGNYFEVLGVRPALGRVLSAADDDVQGAHPVLVLSHAYWTQHFGGDAGVLNHTILVNNTEMTIVGVAQAGFRGIQVGHTPDIFVPMTMKGQMTPIRNGLDDWNDSFLAVLARRKSGVSMEQAQAGINVDYPGLLEQQLAAIPNPNMGAKDRQKFLAKRIELFPGAQGRTVVQRDSGPGLMALFAMVALVLLIACTNVANLLLAKAAARQREFAIRSALGASPGRMMRQLLVESFLCALGGGVLGLILGGWIMNILTEAVVSEAMVQGITARVDGSVLAFATAATAVSALLFGLIPAWRATRTGVSQTLKDQGSTTSAGPAHVRFRKYLVAGQVAFTLLLLTGGALLSGREFNAGDTAANTKVAIVNEAMAKEFFPNRNPIGMHFALGGGNNVKPNIEIVGVVKAVREGHVRDAERPFFYQPYSQFGKLFGMSFYVRTQQDPLLIANTLRETVRGADANLPVYELKTVERVVDEDLFAERVIAGLSAAFGGLAALLAALGIYGVLAYLVVQRTREIGIRVALGAAAGHVRGLVFKEVGWMVLLGAAVGLPLAYGLARLSESLLYGVHAGDVLVYAASLGIICLVAFAACYLPSRRATRIDPIVALRYE